jgi:hypothetical protein
MVDGGFPVSAEVSRCLLKVVADGLQLAQRTDAERALLPLRSSIIPPRGAIAAEAALTIR